MGGQEYTLMQLKAEVYDALSEAKKLNDILSAVATRLLPNKAFTTENLLNRIDELLELEKAPTYE